MYLADEAGRQDGVGGNNYTIGSDRDEFTKARVREDRLHTYHHMVLAVLRGEVARKNLRYVGGRTKCLLAAPMVKPQTKGEVVFAYLRREVEHKNQKKR